jgi:hypothetical protein
MWRARDATAQYGTYRDPPKFSVVLITLDTMRHLPIVVEYKSSRKNRNSRRYICLEVKRDSSIADLSTPRRIFCVIADE